jgi:alginate O-acetyltransferase complex protein AlgI
MLAAERRAGKRGLYGRMPRAVRIGATFVVVCLGWVFFRADTLGNSLDYFASLFGVADVNGASDAVSGILYTPYHLSLFATAAIVVWGMPTTWAFTERLSLPRAASALALLGVAVVLMWTQTTNPFLYFQF